MRALLLVLACSLALAAGEPLQLARLREAAARVASLRVEFTQEKRLALLDEPLRSAGVVEIDRARGALRWEYSGRSLLILAGDRIRRWGADGRPETGDDPSLQALAAQMRALLSGDWSALDRLFTVAADAQGAPALTLTPRDAGLARYVEAIEVRFRDDLSAPASLVLRAPGGDATRYAFGEPQLGAAIPAARFAGP